MKPDSATVSMDLLRGIALSDAGAMSEVWNESHRRKSVQGRPALNLVTHTSQVEAHQPVTVELPDGTMMNSVVLQAADDALHLSGAQR